MSNQQERVEVLKEFQRMRNEQHELMGDLNKLLSTRKEHRLLIKTLGVVKPEGKCFRRTDGFLVARMAKEAIPELLANKENIEESIRQVATVLSSKRQLITQFMEKHNVSKRDLSKFNKSKKTQDEEKKSKNQHASASN